MPPAGWRRNSGGFPGSPRCCRWPYPEPAGSGVPAAGFPYPWSVYRWIDGENLAEHPVADEGHTAISLGRFVAALHRTDVSGAPRAVRDGHVSVLDDRVRGEINDLGADGTIDAGLVTAAWQDALTAPARTSPPALIHADLHPANLLARDGRLAAVIDFGCLGVGDPAVDLLPAWALLTRQTRDLFRAEAGADDATWTRGRGWALGLGLGAACYYRATNPVLAAIGRHSIEEAIADWLR